MSKRQNSPVGRQPREKFPKIKVNKNEDFFVCPFYPSSGFYDRGLKKNISQVLFNSIIAGHKPVILKWWDAELDMSFARPIEEEENGRRSIQSLLKRNFKIGKFFRGRVTEDSFQTEFGSKSSGFRTESGAAIGFQEQSLKSSFTLYTETDFFMEQNSKTKLDPGKAKLFFIAPELTGRDVLFAQDIRIFFDDHSKKRHLEITFSSLGDTLNSVGRSLETMVSFAAPGESFFPFPKIGNELELPEEATEEEKEAFERPIFYQPENDGLVEKEGTKEIYLEPHVKSISGDFAAEACSYQIEFDGATMINSVLFFGRPKQPDLVINEGSDSEKTIPGWQLVARTRPLFSVDARSISAIATTASQTENFFDAQYESAYRTIDGKVFFQNWFSTWQEEYGYFFDPNKQRNSEPIFLAEQENNFFRGDEIFIGKDLSRKNIGVSGNYNLTTSIWSDFQLNARIPDNTSTPITSENDRQIQSHDFSSLINTQALLQMGNSFLEPGGVRTRNSKGFQSAVADSVIAGIGIVAGLGAGFFSGGNSVIALGVRQATVAALAFGTRFLKDAVFRWIPDAHFTSSQVYRPASNTTFLLPKNLLSDLWNKKSQDRNRIPLTIFNNPENNFLSGFVNGKNYKTGWAADLTHRFETSETPEGANRDSLDFFDSSNPISLGKNTSVFGIENNECGYIIDGMIVRSVGRSPYRLTFFNRNGKKIWTTVRNPQSALTGRLLEWESLDIFSDLNENSEVFENEDFKIAPYESREIQRIDDQNTDRDELAAAALRRMNSFNMRIISNTPFQKIWNDDEIINDRGNSKVKNSPSDGYENSAKFAIPDSILDLLKDAKSSSSRPTQAQAMSFLISDYGFQNLEFRTGWNFSMESRVRWRGGGNGHYVSGGFWPWGGHGAWNSWNFDLDWSWHSSNVDRFRMPATSSGSREETGLRRVGPYNDTYQDPRRNMRSFNVEIADVGNGRSGRGTINYYWNWSFWTPGADETAKVRGPYSGANFFSFSSKFSNSPASEFLRINSSPRIEIEGRAGSNFQAQQVSLQSLKARQYLVSVTLRK